ncbi:MAG: hypothetical protein O2960_04785 [Verrucomicrobia bacterium]|nr:hypothetical protein [Verrucomicrobiota bacterium]
MNSILEMQNSVSEGSVEIYRELNRFADQVGTPKGLDLLASVPMGLRVRSIDNLASLREFLRTYYSQVMVPLELPAILNAFHHAARNEARELTELDRSLDGIPILKPFASVSQTVGRAQLRALRPLGDLRVLRRYLNSVESGDAGGWHTVVYGVVLSVYSLPLRQGLIHYGSQTLGGFVLSAGVSLRLTQRARAALHDELCLNLPEAVEFVLSSALSRT